VQLSLLAGTRRGEPAAIEWAKNVLADRIHLGKEITKMGKSHDIPRTALVDAVLDDAKRFQRATSDVVFPSSKTGGRISGFSKLLPKLIKQAGTAPWTMHDLRRSLRTVISKCGYDDEVQRACLGQSAPALDQIYNFDEKFSLRKMAFEAAHAYVAAAVAGQSTDEVVKQQRAANPQNALKLQLLARLAALHAEG
jgi:integrase